MLSTKESIPVLSHTSATAALVSLGLAQIDFNAGQQLFRQLLTHCTENSLKGSKIALAQATTFGLVLAGLYELAPEDMAADVLLEECYTPIHQLLGRLYADHDPQEEGLLSTTVLENTFFPDALIWQDLQLSGGEIAVQDPLLNSIAVWSNECLIDIGTHLGQDVLDLLQWNELTIYSVNDKLWDVENGVYRPFDLTGQRYLPGDSILGLMPMIAEVPDQDRAEEMLEILRSERFCLGGKSQRTCPTHNPADTRAQLQVAGRGGISILANWLLFHGLERYGMFAAAEKLKTDARYLMEKRGFLKAYHPTDTAHEPALDVEDLTAAALCAYWLSPDQ